MGSNSLFASMEKQQHPGLLGKGHLPPICKIFRETPHSSLYVSDNKGGHDRKELR